MTFNLSITVAVLFVCVGLLIFYHWIFIALCSRVDVSLIGQVSNFKIIQLAPETGAIAKGSLLAKVLYLSKQGKLKSTQFYLVQVDNIFSTKENASIACAAYLGKEIMQMRFAPWIRFCSREISKEGRRHIVGGISSGLFVIFLGIVVGIML